MWSFAGIRTCWTYCNKSLDILSVVHPRVPQSAILRGTYCNKSGRGRSAGIDGIALIVWTRRSVLDCFAVDSEDFDIIPLCLLLSGCPFMYRIFIHKANSSILSQKTMAVLVSCGRPHFPARGGRGDLGRRSKTSCG